MTDTFTIGTASDLAADINLGRQARTILTHLKTGKTITNLESVLVYGIYRLSDVIFKLRNAGYDVETVSRRTRSDGSTPPTSWHNLRPDGIMH
jgi:hypothetical protein